MNEIETALSNQAVLFYPNSICQTAYCEKGFEDSLAEPPETLDNSGKSGIIEAVHEAYPEYSGKRLIERLSEGEKYYVLNVILKRIGFLL